MDAGGLIARIPFRRRVVAPACFLLLAALCFLEYLTAHVPAVKELFIALLARVDLAPENLNVSSRDGLIATGFFIAPALPYFFMPRAVELHERGLLVGRRFVPWTDVTRVYVSPRGAWASVDLAWISTSLPKIVIRGWVLDLVLDSPDAEQLAKQIATRAGVPAK